MKRLTSFSKLLITLLIVGSVFFFFNKNGCDNLTDETGATKALLDAGYHVIDVGGYAGFGCSSEDTYRTRFKAYSPDSTRIVTGCVCSGYNKGKTIRLD